MEDWRSLNRQQLDHEFSPSRFSHRMNAEEVINAHVRVLTEESRKAREAVEFNEILLGDSEEQKLHVFTPSTLPKDSPILVYIHGGYWQHLNLDQSSFMALPLLQAGVACATLGYDLCPKVCMEELLKQVERGVAKVLEIASKRGSRGVYLCGHSAGGHLAAMMLRVDWDKYGQDSNLIKGAIPVSGVYDLRPLVNTYVNEPLSMTMESAWELSPLNHVSEISEKSKHKTVMIAYAEHDPPQFRHQSQCMAKELEGNHSNVKCIQVMGMDHFDVIEKLADPNYSLTKDIIALINNS